MNQNLPLPKYHQIYLVLCEKLQEGKFDSGLPGELALMQQYSVARVTVRRALSQMAEEGLIKREPGRGTRPLHQKGFDKPVKLSQVSNHEGQQARLTGLLENLVTMGLRTSVKVISVQHLKAPKDIGDKLQLTAGAMVQKAERVRSTREGLHAYCEHARLFAPWHPQSTATYRRYLWAP